MLKNLLNKIFFAKKEECLCHEHEKTLLMATSGRQFRVECLRGEAGLCQRLREMGFCESAVVEKVSESGALLCKVCDAKVAISKDLAENIIVKDICTCKEHQMSQENKNVVLLSQMTVGQRGIIRDFVLESDDCERVEEMGITPGETIEIVRYAPMGDPIEVKIRGYLLSLRKQEADFIQVTLTN